MGHGIAVKAADYAGGAQIAGGQNFVKIDGRLIVVKGDPVTPHPPKPPHSSSPKMVQGTSWFKINGIPVCRKGHKANCGHATTGRGWITITD